MRKPILFALLALCLAAAQARPVFETLDGNQPVRLQSVQVRTEITAGMARTTLRMEVANPNPRQLEATLQLPLSPAQQVSGFALDIGGVLRPAVTVDKARGQQVFEAIQRQRVDPALLEHTAGNNFRLRVYPVPPQGRRIVEVTIIEALALRGGAWRYRPPLQDAGKDAEVSIDVEVEGDAAPRVDGLPGARFAAAGNGWRLRQAGAMDLGFEIQVGQGTRPQLLVQDHAGARYFVARVPVAADSAARRPLPRVLGLLWDSSGSGAKRDHAAELEALGHYLQAAGTLEVRLLRLRDRAEPARVFRIVDGDWHALRAELQRTAYDGATALGGIAADDSVDTWLLVSDGLHNYGTSGLPANRPLHVLSSAPGADRERLDGLAARSGGVVADISAGLAPADAAALLARGRQALPVLSIPGAADVVPDPAGVQDGWLRIAGRVAGAGDTLTLQRGGEDIDLSLSGADGGFAALLWARYQLHRLGAEPERNAAMIRQLGRDFTIPTRTTSLIVLETLQDYLRHDIVPPADMQAAFRQAREQLARSGRQQERDRLDQVAARFGEKVQWWKKRFSHGAPPPAPKVVELEMVATAPSSPPPPMPRISMSPPAEPAADLRAAGARQEAPGAPQRSRTAAPAGIRLNPWSPKAPYMARLQRASKARLYATYLAEKERNPASTAFFLDAAGVLLDRGERMLALRVMSNVAEMELGNRHILRVLAYRLMQAGEPALALPVLQKVRELAPEEPQSFRDLGLAYAATGQGQKAIDSLYDVVKGKWDWRFAEVELIALAELNAIVARQPSLNTRHIDRRLLRNLPLDLRVVLSWDADNTDMDLWVTDPNGEVCNYANRTTFQGGRMSDDFTGGYGPEEFSLRRAKPGIYKVHAQFYGHNQQSVAGAPTLQLDFWSGFGTKDGRHKTIGLRLEGRGEHVFVGEFEVK